MCGITGIIGTPVHEDRIVSMLEKISHRGPDGSDICKLTDAHFGHCRLSIIDLSHAGNQPMCYMGRYTITFNGEIYNYLELKDELTELGYLFESRTDTEILLAAFDAWGTDMFHRLTGMWAFVLYDAVQKKYLISRDRFGEKPLFYKPAETYFEFSSEAKSLLDLNFEMANFNKDYLKEYLKNGALEYNSETAFEGIFRFPAAHYFWGTKDELFQNPKFVKYWSLQFNTSNEKYNHEKALQHAKTYYNLLYSAVDMRLRADVKVGSALSGGLDSSSIVYLINQINKSNNIDGKQETFSSVYHSENTSDCDESAYIQLLAEQLSIVSNTIEPKAIDIPDELEKFLYIMDNPPESTCMSGWHTFKLVNQKNVKVTLDGQGADELLGGYTHYLVSYLLSLSMPDFISQAFLFKKKQTLPTKKIVQVSCLKVLKYMLGGQALTYFLDKIFGYKIFDNLNRQLQHDVETNLINLLQYSDRVSMAFGVESRMPFLDHKLAEFLASLPVCYKYHDGWSKYVARLAFDGKLPNEICWRTDKMGWPVPERTWFTGDLKPFLHSTLERSALLRTLLSKDEFSFNIEGENIKHLIRSLNIAILEKLVIKQ